MVINTETHNWQRNTGQEIAECLALNMTPISQPLLLRLRDHFGKGCRWYKERVSSVHSRAAAHRNSKQLQQHAQDPYKLKSYRVSAQGMLTPCQGIIWLAFNVMDRFWSQIVAVSAQHQESKRKVQFAIGDIQWDQHHGKPFWPTCLSTYPCHHSGLLLCGLCMRSRGWNGLTFSLGIVTVRCHKITKHTGSRYILVTRNQKEKEDVSWVFEPRQINVKFFSRKY